MLSNSISTETTESVPIFSDKAYTKFFPSHAKARPKHRSLLARPIVDGILQLLQHAQPGNRHHVCMVDLETSHLLFSDKWFNHFLGNRSTTSEVNFQDFQTSALVRAFREYPTSPMVSLLLKISNAWENAMALGRNGSLSIYHRLKGPGGVSCPVITQCHLAPVMMEDSGEILIAHVTEVRHLAQLAAQPVLGSSLIFAEGTAMHWHLDFLSGNLVDKPLISNMELKVLTMIADGHSSRHIAEHLGTSPSTADTHRRNICRKLSCVDTTAAVQLCLLMGWL